MTKKRRCWLIKSEPGEYSIDDLARDGKTAWEGVRNYQARNYLRDELKLGDLVLYYHSNADPPGVAGICRVSRESYPDPTALDPSDPHYDPKATAAQPIWMAVDVEMVEKFPQLVSLDVLRAQPKLADLMVLRRGMRLSIQPVDPKHMDLIRRLGTGPAS
jgi:predicted RNA-binding protein with PUA-like domain